MVASCAESNDWAGTYFFEADLGKNIAEDSIIVEYTLSINQNKCAISIVGYQVYESLVCEFVLKSDELKVFFKSYENGSTKNKHDVEMYNRDDPMFVLRNKNNIVTEWGQLNPGESLENTGKYFTRSQ